MAAAPSHVLFTHPSFWPHVMRGAEREIHDVGARLVSRGHRIDLLTSQPSGVTSSAVIDGINVRYLRTIENSRLARRGLRPETQFGGIAAVGAAGSHADLVVSYLYPDALGASYARRIPLRSRRKVVLKLTGSNPKWFVQQNNPREHSLIARALDAVDEIWVNSTYVVESMADWGHQMRLMPAGVDEALFAPVGDRAPEPIVLCTAAPAEKRKCVADLTAAWPKILAAMPTARLQIAGHCDDVTKARLLEGLSPSVTATIDFIGSLSGRALVEAYSNAWVTVAPAVYEALGLATLESLACGTPVAGADSGATPSLLDQPGTGTVFTAQSPSSLAEAVVTTAAWASYDPPASASEPSLRQRCRTSALRYAWPSVIDRYEERFAALID